MGIAEYGGSGGVAGTNVTLMAQAAATERSQHGDLTWGLDRTICVRSATAVAQRRLCVHYCRGLGPQVPNLVETRSEVSTWQ